MLFSRHVLAAWSTGDIANDSSRRLMNEKKSEQEAAWSIIVLDKSGLRKGSAGT